MRFLTFVFTLAAALPVVGQDKKSPVPDGSSQKDAERLIREIFKDDYAKRSQPDRVALAKKLLEQASQTNDSPASQYVLLREARDLASQGGDLDSALKAIDQIAAGYDGETVSMKSSVLAVASKSAKSPEDFQKLARGYLALTEEAAAGELIEAAEKAAEQAVSFAKKGKDIPLLAKTEGKSRELTEVRAAVVQTAKAKESLAKNPDDPAANLVLGQQLCFTKGDWDKGLRHLLKGGDVALKSLAGRDLAQPTAGPEQLALGDSWWEQGEKQSGQIRKALRVRGAFWYSQALPGLSGLSKARVEKRLKEADPANPPKTGDQDLLTRIDPVVDSLKGSWRMENGKLLAPAVNESVFSACTVPYVPPEEYDLTIVAERRSGRSSLLVGLVGSGKQFDLELDGGGGAFSGLDRIDGKWALQNETRFRGGVFAVGTPHTVVIRMRTGKVTVLLDDEEVVSWAADYRRVSTHPSITLKNSESLFLGTWQSEYLIHRFTVKQVTGEGRFQR
jgi:hypothetical protein